MSKTLEISENMKTDNNVLHTKQSEVATKITSSNSQITANVINNINEKLPDGAQIKFNDSINISNNNLKTSENILKNKRKRRRGKSKNQTKPYKKSNWKFQMPQRYRNARDKILRSRCIVPYNTNKFLMEEHMNEVPSALLTPSGRTRDSSFSVDSEDNYLYSMAEDEEQFLTKEFTSVYERARVERLEGMSKQQLIEECLQLDDRYIQTSEHQHQHTNNNDLMNKIKFLEDKVRELSAENSELRRKLDYAQNKIPQDRRMSCSSEDSESDSTSSSSSSSSSSHDSSDYSPNSSVNTNDELNDNNAHNNNNNNSSRLESNDENIDNNRQQQQQQNQLENGNEIICNGHADSPESNLLNHQSPS